MMKVGAAIPLLLLMAPACGAEGSDDRGGAGSADSTHASGGSESAGAGGVSGGGSAGSSGAGGNAGAPFVAPENPDANTLAACELTDPCSESYIQEAEAAGYNVHVEGSACLLEALAQRTPGRYLHNTDATTAGGSTGAEHRFIIAADGSVVYVRTAYDYMYPFDPERFPQPDPGQRCTLKPPELFEACRDAVLTETPSVDDSYRQDAMWICLFGDGTTFTPTHLDWFESCETESPISCE